MAILVVFSCKAFSVVRTSRNGTLFRPFWLVGEHVRLQILEGFAAVRVRAANFLPSILVQAVGAWASH